MVLSGGYTHDYIGWVRGEEDWCRRANAAESDIHDIGRCVVAWLDE